MNARKLSQSTDPFIKSLYAVVAAAQIKGQMAGDEYGFRFTGAEVDSLKALQWGEVKARALNLGSFQSPDECYAHQLLKIAPKIMNGDTSLQSFTPEGQMDTRFGSGQYNTKWGYGTLSDPSMYSSTNIPVMFGPTEATAVYANGGLPAQIVDKKTRAMVMHGVTFKTHDTKLWTADKIEMLEEAAEATGLNGAMADAITDAFLQGGSTLYPVFKGDTSFNMLRDLDKMNLEKGCIERWVETDRWNVTIVPSFIVTAADYLHPRTILVPMGNVEVNTSRACLLKPKQLPYWAALYNIGWCPSDLNGWMRAYYAYEITQMSVPVMAQQMSLLLYRMPLDGLNATIGPENVQKLMAVNKEEMSKWSSLNPEAVNMVGEVEVVNRTYSGFDLFVGATKSELSAQCGIPEPSLWHTPNKGFSDNMTESLLKQSETLQLAKQSVERFAYPARDALIAHVFGSSSEEFKQRNTLRIVFDKPVISTEKDMAEIGARFAASVNSFVQAGVSPDVAIELSKPFFPSIKVTDEMIAKAKESYDKIQEQQMKMGQMNKLGGTSNTGSAKQQSINTGHGTKGGKA